MSYRLLKTHALASVLALSILSVACDSPTLPVPIETPPPVELNYTVAGVVTEITDGGLMPVEGIVVRESSTNRPVVTDSTGFYSIPGIKTRFSSVSASKDGYTPVTAGLTATTDTRLDIRVERIVTYTLFGMAYEQTVAGRVPIADVVLYCDGCGSPVGHTFVTTDADGLYSFSWVHSGTTYLQVMGKEGYAYVGPASTDFGVPITTVGHTRFDVEFVRR